jgi:hypothetical protein
MKQYYSFVGTKSKKKYHFLDDGFISKFDMKKNGGKCHWELFQNNPDFEREICTDYVLNLKLSDFRVCDNGEDRIMVQGDLTEQDWSKQKSH